MCMEPVGDGAMRVTTGRSGAGMRVPVEAGGEVAPEGGAPWPWAGSPITRPIRLPSVAATLAWLRAQAILQLDRVLLWAPVAFGVGAATYLGLKSEPSMALALAIACAGLFAFAAARWLARGRAPVAVV